MHSLASNSTQEFVNRNKDEAALSSPLGKPSHQETQSMRNSLDARFFNPGLRSSTLCLYLEPVNILHPSRKTLSTPSHLVRRTAVYKQPFQVPCVYDVKATSIGRGVPDLSQNFTKVLSLKGSTLPNYAVSTLL